MSVDEALKTHACLIYILTSLCMFSWKPMPVHFIYWLRYACFHENPCLFNLYIDVVMRVFIKTHACSIYILTLLCVFSWKPMPVQFIYWLCYACFHENPCLFNLYIDYSLCVFSWKPMPIQFINWLRYACFHENPCLFNLYIDFIMRVFMNNCTKDDSIWFFKHQHRINARSIPREQRLRMCNENVRLWGFSTVLWCHYVDDLRFMWDNHSLQRATTIRDGVFTNYGLCINVSIIQLF